MILEMIHGILAGGSAIALLIFSGITLTCSAIVFLISTPLFVIFSPVLVPATIATTLLATGFTASGSFLSTAISIISWIIKKLTGAGGGAGSKIPGMSPGGIYAKKEEEKKDKKRKKSKGKKDQKNMKNAKENVKESHKMDNKKEKKKEKKKGK